MPRTCGGCNIDMAADPSTNELSFLDGSATDIVNGQCITIIIHDSGALPAPLAERTNYYVKQATSTKFKVGLSLTNPAVIDLTTAGNHFKLDTCSGP